MKEIRLLPLFVSLSHFPQYTWKLKKKKPYRGHQDPSAVKKKKKCLWYTTGNLSSVSPTMEGEN